MNPSCARCSKTVYPVDKLSCLDKQWHKACFSCEVCGLKLTMNTYKGYQKKPYCKTHYPQQTGTAVSETPESLRLKKQTERQSAVAYHKQYEDEKGTYTQTPTTVAMETAKKTQFTKIGYDQRDQVSDELAKDHATRQDAPSSHNEEEHVAAPPTHVHHHVPTHHEEEHHDEPPRNAAPAPSGPRYKAVYDYEASDGDEVSFQEGDIIINVEVIDEGWMNGTVERTGASGMLPSNYVEAL